MTTAEVSMDQQLEDLVAAARDLPGVAVATDVFESALRQSPSDGRRYDGVTTYATGANRA